MGCDVHLWAEYLSHQTGKWMIAKRPLAKCEDCGGTGKTENKKGSCYWCDGRGERSPDFYEGRCYDDFAIMADVRNGRGFAGIKTGGGFKPISEPRGVPKNATDYYKRQVQKWNADGHSHSFLTLKELLDYDWTQVTSHNGVVSASAYADWWKNKGKKGSPASYCGGVSGPDIVMISNLDMEKLVTEHQSEIKPIDKMTWGVDDIKVDGKQHYTNVEWYETYKDSAVNLWLVTIPALQELADKKKLPPEKIRIVFFFDN